MKHCTLLLISFTALIVLLPLPSHGQSFFEQLPEPAGGHVYAVECNANGDPVCVTKTRIYRWDPAKGEWEVAESYWTDSNDKKLYRAPNGRLFASVVTARLYASDDDGATWTKLTGLAEYSRDITATASGALFNAGNGVKMSTDDGSTWVDRSAGMENEYIHGITVHENGTLFSCAPLTGIFRSSNDGLEWELISGSPTYMYDLFVSSKGTIWAVGNDGAYSSTDQGDTWALSTAPTKVRSITEHPSGDLFATSLVSADPILRSTDDGLTWTPIASGDGGSQIHNLAFDATGRGYCATWNGVLTSVDGTTPWQLQNSGLRVTTIRSIVEDSDTSLLLTVDGVGLLRSTDQGQHWTTLPNTENMSNVHLLLRRHDSLFAASSDWLYLSLDHGMNWEILNPDDRFATGNDVLIDGTGAILVANQNGVSFSSDAGAHWEERNGGLPACEMFALGMLADGTLLGATYEDGVYFSTDRGHNWVKSSAFPDGMRVLSCATDSDRIVYIGSRGSGCYRSTDMGVHWQQLTAGFDNRYVKELYVSESGSVYASTNTGVFHLEQSSGTWIRLLGIEYQCNVIYESTDHNLYAGTDSEGLYVSRNSLPTSAPASPVPLTPANSSDEIGTHSVFSWQEAPTAMYYKLQVSTQPDMSSPAVDSAIAAVSSLDIYNLTVPMKYYWRMAAGNTAGESAWSPVWSFNTGKVTGITDFTDTQFQLEQNYPNPCSASTMIRFYTRNSTSANLAVYSLLGQKLLTLFNGRVTSGAHEIPLTIDLPPGVYVYRLLTENGSAMRRFVVME
jgi:hypothetical protein